MINDKNTILHLIANNLHTAEDFDAFFSDILTPHEYNELLNRVLICRELKKGKTVKEVCDELDVASATVVRGNRILKYGSGKIGKIVQQLVF